MRRPRTAALSAIVAGTGLLAFSVGGVGAVSQDVRTADQQQRLERVRQVVDRGPGPCPFEGREQHHRSGTEL